jgi:hypothetical protein
MPFAVDAHIDAKALFMDLGATGRGAGMAHATAALDILPDWSVRAHTAGDLKLDESRISVGSMWVDLTDMLNKNAANLSQPMFSALDRDIPKLLRLKPQMEMLWADAFKPIRIGKKPLTWLLLQPDAIRFAEPVTSDNALDIAVAIDGRARAVVAEEPPAATPTRLPDLGALETPANSFRFAVPATVSYDEAARLAMQALEQHPIQLPGGMRVRIARLAILPSGSDVVVETQFCMKQGWWDIFDWFDSCGIGYLRGAPTFDAKTQTIRVADVHYDVATARAVLSVARAFEGDAFGKELEKRLVFPVAKDIAKLQADVRKALAEPRGGDIVISGTVTSFGDPTLSWTESGFFALFTAEGDVRATLNLH